MFSSKKLKGKEKIFIEQSTDLKSRRQQFRFIVQSKIFINSHMTLEHVINLHLYLPSIFSKCNEHLRGEKIVSHHYQQTSICLHHCLYRLTRRRHEGWRKVFAIEYNSAFKLTLIGDKSSSWLKENSFLLHIKETSQSTQKS